jgi:hypothetical protein
MQLPMQNGIGDMAEECAWLFWIENFKCVIYINSRNS